MNDEISKALGLTPLPVNTLPEVVNNVPSNIDADFEYARGNMLNIIEKGSEAINGILDVANMSQNPRSYEVAATLLKTMAEVNKDLLELSKKRKDLTGESTVKTVNNNLFVGSTAELQKLIKNGDV